MSQATLARLAGVDSGYLTRCEQGKRVPTTAELVGRLADALRCSRDETNALLVAAGFLPPELARIGPGDPEIVLLARLLDPTVVPEATRQAVRGVVRDLARLVFPSEAEVAPSIMSGGDVAPPPGGPASSPSPVASARRRRRRRSTSKMTGDGSENVTNM
jgi:transcriptional regulator with XRE-family HTH domain